MFEVWEKLQVDGKEHKFMRLSSAIGERCFYTLAVILLMLPAGFARERGPRVEVVCPSPPVPAKLAEKQTLVYELHVTNFETVPVTLKRLEVFADADESQPLSVISGDDLPAIMIEAGSMSSTKYSKTIGPAKRTIIFMWIELVPDTRAPAVLLHRMVFAAGEPGGNAAETVLEKFPVVVSQDAVPLLSPPFDGGIWLAGNGPSNDSDHRLTIVAVDGHVHIAQRFAIDWVKVGPNGDSHNGTTRNDNWWGYGEPIHSVADGSHANCRRNTGKCLASSHVDHRQHLRKLCHCSYRLQSLRHVRSFTAPAPEFISRSSASRRCPRLSK